MGGSGSKPKENTEGETTSIRFGNDDTPAPETNERRSSKSKPKKSNAESKPAKPAQVATQPAVVANGTSPPKNITEKLENASKKAKSRLTAVDLSQNAAFKDHKEDAEAQNAARIFAAPKGPERSKIFQALNPDKLWYETRREKAEASDEKMDLGRVGSRDYNILRDEDGNIVEEEEDEDGVPDEADYDTDDAPDFGDMAEEMKVLRLQREKEEEEHRAKLRAAYQAKKAKEEEVRQAELAKIKAKEDALKAQLEQNDDSFVVEAQQRLAEEANAHLATFSYQT